MHKITGGLRGTIPFTAAIAGLCNSEDEDKLMLTKFAHSVICYTCCSGSHSANLFSAGTRWTKMYKKLENFILLMVHTFSYLRSRNLKEHEDFYKTDRGSTLSQVRTILASIRHCVN